MSEAVRFADMTDGELIELAKACFDAVYVVDCFGMTDVRNLDGAIQVLGQRGYEVRDVSHLVIEKEEGSDENSR